MFSRIRSVSRAGGGRTSLPGTVLFLLRLWLWLLWLAEAAIQQERRRASRHSSVRTRRCWFVGMRIPFWFGVGAIACSRIVGNFEKKT